MNMTTLQEGSDYIVKNKNTGESSNNREFNIRFEKIIDGLI